LDKSQRADETAAAIVDAAVKLHIQVGPGLLESVYEIVFANRLMTQGHIVEKQKKVPIVVDGIRFAEGFRADLFVDGCVIVELKSVESLLPLHSKQLLTYLRLMDLPIGLVINFGGLTLRENIRRVVNNFALSSFSRLRVNQLGSSTNASSQKSCDQ
jgi:GxxExxY protein